MVGTGPDRILLVASTHGDEPEGGRHADRLLSWLSSDEGPRFPRCTIRLVRDANPDGTAIGRRAIANAVDLNRNWPSANFTPSRFRGLEPLDQPESAALYAEIESFAPDLVVVFHSTRHRSAPLVNFDGPAESHARAFAGGATASSRKPWDVLDEWGHTPGSLGSLIGDDRGIPILTSSSGAACANEARGSRSWAGSSGCSRRLIPATLADEGRAPNPAHEGEPVEPIQTRVLRANSRRRGRRGPRSNRKTKLGIHFARTSLTVTSTFAQHNTPGAIQNDNALAFHHCSCCICGRHFVSRERRLGQPV